MIGPGFPPAPPIWPHRAWRPGAYSSVYCLLASSALRFGDLPNPSTPPAAVASGLYHPRDKALCHPETQVRPRGHSSGKPHSQGLAAGGSTVPAQEPSGSPPPCSCSGDSTAPAPSPSTSRRQQPGGIHPDPSPSPNFFPPPRGSSNPTPLRIGLLPLLSPPLFWPPLRNPLPPPPAASRSGILPPLPPLAAARVPLPPLGRSLPSP